MRRDVFGHLSRIPKTVRIGASALVVVLAASLLVVFSRSYAARRPERRARRDVDARPFARRLENVTDAFKGYVHDGKLAGAVVLVAHRGKVVYHEPFGFRDREAKAPMKRDTHPPLLIRIGRPRHWSAWAS